MKRIMTFRSLNARISLVIVSCLVLLFALLQLDIIRQMEATVHPLRRQLTADLVEAKSELMGEWLSQRSEELALIASTLDYLVEKENVPDADYLEALLSGRGDIYESFGLVDPEGMIIVTGGSRFSITGRDYYTEALNRGGPVISNPVRSRSNSRDIVVMLHPLSALPGYFLSAAVPIEILKIIAAGINIYDGQGYIRYDGAESAPRSGLLVFSSRIPHSPSWSLEFHISEERMMESSRRLRTGSSLTVILTGIVMLVLLSFSSASIVRPLQRLQEIMKGVEEGNTELRFPAERKDEIGQLARNLNTMLEEIYRTQREKKEIALQLMQEQIKPHFLYNTLETLRWMAGDYEADELVVLIEALSTYFRIGLSRGEPFITLEQELDHTESYLQIQKARFEERLDYQIRYDEIEVERKIPRILIQPLVENAIDHGIKQLDRGRLEIRLEQKGSRLLISVENDGPEPDPSRLRRIQDALDDDRRDPDLMGFGLYSVHHRVRSLYGEGYGLSLSARGGRFLALLALPGGPGPGEGGDV